MEDSPIIAGVLIVAIVFAARYACAALNRLLGPRELGAIGSVAMVATGFVVMWMASHLVSPDSYYWFVAIAASSAVGLLVSTALFGKPRQDNPVA